MTDTAFSANAEVSSTRPAGGFQPAPGLQDPQHLVAAALPKIPLGVIRKRNALSMLVKRTLDYSVGAVLLMITSPVMAAIAIIIRLESPGPAIFRQQRVGKDGRVFTFYKFRTMYSDARTKFPELYQYRYSKDEFESLYYKPAVDPRNTRFGRWIRKTTLDELPNLVNVVKGDISLVGPRPELPEYVQYYSTEQLAKFACISGMTGLAQVSGRNNLSVQEQIALDVEYVRTASLVTDFKLLVRTVVAVTQRVGAE